MGRADSCQSDDYAVGKTIDERYTLTEFIGSGGMACVYKAFEPDNPHPYALKFLKPEFHQQEVLTSYFEHEAENMKNLAHPNIVRFYRFVKRERYSYIVMDYVEGYSLAEILKTMYERKEYIPLDEIVRVMVQVARALDAIHRENFIHRDIKPGNILISTAAESKGKAYLSDLGITASIDKVVAGAGTLAYMAPEQHVRGQIGHRSDIYSFGIMLFELLARQRPFRTDRRGSTKNAEESLINQHLSAPIPDIVTFRPGLPPKMNLIMRKALAKNPQDRYQNVMELIRDVHETLKSQLAVDLQDFNAITHVRIVPTTTPVPNMEVPAAGAAVPDRRGLWLAVVALLVIVGLWVIISSIGSSPPAAPASPAATVTVDASAQVALAATVSPDVTVVPATAVISTPVKSPEPSATDTAWPTSLPSATDTPVPTSTRTATPRPSPTTAATPTPIAPSPPAELTPSATSTQPLRSVATSPGYLLVSGSAALAAPAEPDALLIPAGETAYLRVGAVSDFRLTVQFQPEGDITAYGVQFRVQDESNYWRLKILPGEQSWQIMAVHDGEETPQAAGNLEALSGRIIVAVELTLLTVDAGDSFITYTLPDTQPGSLALWVEGSDEAALRLNRLTIELLGTDREAALQQPPTPAPGLVSLRQRLAAEVAALLATRDSLNLTIDCAVYIPVFARLDDYLTAGNPGVADSARQVKRAGEGIYNRCLSESPDARLSFQTGVQDFNTWETALLAIAAQLRVSGE